MGNALHESALRGAVMICRDLELVGNGGNGNFVSIKGQPKRLMLCADETLNQRGGSGETWRRNELDVPGLSVSERD